MIGVREAGRLGRRGPMRYIQMTVSRHDARIFTGVVECVDLKDLADAVAEGVRALQRANPRLVEQTPLEALSIDLVEVSGKTAP
jgi:hypothetical protein